MSTIRMFSVKVAIAAFAVVHFSVAQADVFTNITAVVRDGNAAVISMEKGTCKEAWYSVRKAFDGKIGDSTWDGNVMVVEKPTEENPVIVRYSLADDFQLDSRFVVTAFRFYSSYSNTARSIAKIRLEASEDGNTDWCVLGENTFDVSLATLQEKVCTPFTVQIPAFARRDARHYRFVITDNLGYEGNPQGSQDPSLWISELELLGEILESRNLVWDGGDGGIWDGSAQNWKTEGGDAASWAARRSAIIGNSLVSLSGEAEVSELMLTNTLTPQTVSGGTLAMRIPGRISARHGDVITSAVAAGLVQTNLFECGDDYGFPPVDSTDTKTGVEDVFFSHCRVSEIIGAPEEPGNYRVYFSASENGYYPSYPMYFKIEDFGLSFQVHTHADRDQYIAGEKFVLRQSGDNVLGRACWSKFNNTSGIAEPYDFELLTSSWAYLVLPKYGRTGYGNNGIRNLQVIADVSSALTVDCGGKVVFPAENWLPRTEDKREGVAATFIEDDVLATIGDIVSAQGVYYAHDCGLAEPYFVVRAEGRATVQFQFAGPDFNHCIKVEFVQNGRNIDVRAIYAKTGRKNLVPIGTDFDDPMLGSNVWGGDLGKGDASGGINIRNIVVKRAGKVHLDGTFCGDRSVMVYRGVTELGAASLTLSQRFSGDGTLAFAPTAGSQAVSFGGYCDCGGGMELSGATTVTVSRSDAFATALPMAFKGGGAEMALAANTTNSVGTVQFAGVTTLSVASDAQFSMHSATFADDAVINLIADTERGVKSIRVGTARCLTKSELSHFRVDGKPVTRQTEDGWLDLHRYGFKVIVQ